MNVRDRLLHSIFGHMHILHSTHSAKCYYINMDSLRLLMIQNQSLLDKLRARTLYCGRAITAIELDTHKQYGPFAGYWDEWLIQAEEMREELSENITGTALFLAELREFVAALEQKKKLSRSDTSYLVEVSSLTEGKIAEQKELLDSINVRIELHYQLTEKLRLVEAIDSLSDE